MIFCNLFFSFSPISLVQLVKAEESTSSESSSSAESEIIAPVVSSESSESSNSSESVASSSASSSESSTTSESSLIQVSEIKTTEPDVFDSIASTLYTIAPFIFTDKPDYSPTDNVVISGNGLAINTLYIIVVSSTDEPAITHTDNFTTSSTGSFTYDYQLDGNYRPNYIVQIKDNDGNIVSSTTFTDSRTINSVTLNGGSSVTVLPGESITVSVNATVSGSTAWGSTSWQLSLFPLIPSCKNTPNHNANGTYTETFTVTAPSFPGTYNSYFRIHSGDSCSILGQSSLYTISNSIHVVVPDLKVTKTNDVSGVATVGNTFNWILEVSNVGHATAVFGNNSNVLLDNLPILGESYGSPEVTLGDGVIGSLSCSISSSFLSFNTLNCTTNSLSIPVGSVVQVKIPVTPSSEGTIRNPRLLGLCLVDPSNSVSEENELNNSCEVNTVKVIIEPTLTITKSATNEVNNSHTFEVKFGQNDSDSFIPVPLHTFVTVSIASTDPSVAVIDDNCSNPGTINGICTYTINSSSAGIYTASATASVEYFGRVFEISTTESAVKTYVDGKIVLTPEEAYNNILVAHEVTATVTKNPGKGEVSASDELVTFSLPTNDSEASFVEDINTCTTNELGKCSVSINSSKPGNVKIQANVDVHVGELTLNRTSAEVSKIYQAGRITIVKKTLPELSHVQFKFNTPYRDDILLKDGESYDSGYLALGEYGISEDVPEGWTLSNIDCVNNNENLSRLTSVEKELLNGTYIELGANDDYTCTFTNVRNPFITISTTNVDLVGAEHTFTIKFGQEGSFYPVPDGTKVIVKVSPEGYIPLVDTCSATGTIGGYCTYTITSLVTAIYTATASGNVTIDGKKFVVLTGDGETSNDGVAKETYVDGKIVISPDSSIDNVNTTHTISANVTKDIGAGFKASIGSVLTFSLKNNSFGAYFVGGINTCTTDSSGTCSVKISSANIGTLQIQATASITEANLTFERQSNLVSDQFISGSVLGASDGKVLAVTGDQINLNAGIIFLALAIALVYLVSSKHKGKKNKGIFVK